MTALGEAARAGDTDAVRELLREGAEPDAVDARGLPPLCAAVAAYAHEAADLLVEAGADPDRVLPDGTTPLLRAVESGSPAVVRALLWSRDLPDVGHPRLESIGLRYAVHPAPRVRMRAVYCMGWSDGPFTAAERGALGLLAGDPDDEVRFCAVLSLLAAGQDVDALHGVVRDLVRDPRSPMRRAAADSMAESADRTADATDLLLSLLDADEPLTRLIGAYGLALRDHPDTPEAYARVEELGPLFSPDHRVNALWGWKERNDPARGAAGARYPDGTE